MRKILFAALAVFALASCAKDVTTDVQQYAIDFVPSAKGAVRSTVYDSNNLMRFNAVGYHNSALYLDAVVSRATSTSAWTYSPKKYWPAEGSVDFYGLFMENLGSSDGEYQSSFTHTAAGYKLDLRMSPTDESIRTSYIPDPVYAVALDKTSADSPVTMQFRHAMAEVDFLVKNATTSGLNITIAPGDVYIEDLSYQGIYTTPAKSTTETLFVGGSWSFENEVTDYLFKADGVSVSSGKTVDMLGDRCLVFPQTKASAKLVVNCTIMQGGVVIFNGQKTATLNVNWKEGKKYVYTLLFDDKSIEDLSKPIEFTATVKDMDTETLDPVRPN